MSADTLRAADLMVHESTTLRLEKRRRLSTLDGFGIRQTICGATNSNFSDLLKDKIDNATGNKQNL